MFLLKQKKINKKFNLKFTHWQWRGEYFLWFSMELIMWLRSILNRKYKQKYGNTTSFHSLYFFISNNVEKKKIIPNKMKHLLGLLLTVNVKQVKLLKSRNDLAWPPLLWTLTTRLTLGSKICSKRKVLGTTKSLELQSTGKYMYN